MPLSDRTLYIFAINERNKLAEMLIFFVQQTKFLADPDKKDEAAERMLGSWYKTREELNRTVPQLCEQYEGMTDPSFRDAVREDVATVIPEFERILLESPGIGAGDALALYDLPETPQEAFALGWNRRHDLAAVVAAEAMGEVPPVLPPVGSAAEEQDSVLPKPAKRVARKKDSINTPGL